MVVKPGSVFRVKGEGMPSRSRLRPRGDLILQFEIVFPEKLEADQKEMLGLMLPNVDPIPKSLQLAPPSEQKPGSEGRQAVMQKYSIEEMERMAQSQGGRGQQQQQKGNCHVQ
eukprot:NODE_3811_length_894_cov_27.052151_g3658_i0.p2 GENE.NODE_3811_length_894_cov_27.052151_g3658_i0~~NODE_3811_length_894_cov_27.052151_g3658_i0.p2  ORF type:complete len:113 (-),score=28.95 NODE_3811_length_894_cov_27.052151_g3658_i0:132-470(-)